MCCSTFRGLFNSCQPLRLAVFMRDVFSSREQEDEKAAAAKKKMCIFVCVRVCLQSPNQFSFIRMAALRNNRSQRRFFTSCPAKRQKPWTDPGSKMKGHPPEAPKGRVGGDLNKSRRRNTTQRVTVLVKTLYMCRPP